MSSYVMLLSPTLETAWAAGMLPTFAALAVAVMAVAFAVGAWLERKAGTERLSEAPPRPPLPPKDYEPTSCEAVRRFDGVRRKSQCIFAKRARLWGGADWDDSATLEQNVARSALMLQHFARDVAAGAALDGFIIEIRGAAHGESPRALGVAVLRALGELSRLDPTGRGALSSPKGVGFASWSFKFAAEPFFVTTFAPCYPSHSSRYMYGASAHVHVNPPQPQAAAPTPAPQSPAAPLPEPTAGSAGHPKCEELGDAPVGGPRRYPTLAPRPAESSFILLQPHESFGRHRLGADTPRSATEWSAPRTPRDRIRAAFAKAGQPYDIPEDPRYPAAEHIVKPTELGAPPVRWWELGGGGAGGARPGAGAETAGAAGPQTCEAV